MVPFSHPPLCNLIAPNLADPRLNFQRKQVIPEEKLFLCRATFQRVC